MQWFKNQKAQSTAEYALVIAIVLAALVGMQTYLKRGMQARFRAVSNTLTSTGGMTIDDGAGNTSTVFQANEQYEPYYAKSDYENERTSDVQERLTKGGAVARTIQGAGEETKRTGSQEEQVDLSADNTWK